MRNHHRLPALDGLRAISILLVMGCHMVWLGPKFLHLNYTAGAMGMSLFFCLSGFLIASALIRNQNVVEFMIRRLAKIVPLAFAYAFFLLLIFHDWREFISLLTFTGNYHLNSLTENSAHFWSLCVEVHFYILIALTVLLGGRFAIFIVWPACLLVTALHIKSGVLYPVETHLRLDEILSGACVGTIYGFVWKEKAPIVPAWTFFVFAALWFVSSHSQSGYIQYTKPYVTAAMLAVTLCHDGTKWFRFLSSKPLRYIAEISYALYIVHPITVHGWFNEGTIAVRYLLKRPVSFALTFAAAHILTRYWEQVWTQKGRQLIFKMREQRATSGLPGNLSDPKRPFRKGLSD